MTIFMKLNRLQLALLDLLLELYHNSVHCP